MVSSVCCAALYTCCRFSHQLCRMLRGSPPVCVCVCVFPPPLPNVTQFIAFSLHWSTEKFDSSIFFFFVPARWSFQHWLHHSYHQQKRFFPHCNRFFFKYIYIIVLIGQFTFCSINFLFSLMTGLECFPSKNTVRHTHPVELPRWVRRLSHASELPSHSIYCGDYTKRKKKKKWNERKTLLNAICFWVTGYILTPCVCDNFNSLTSTVKRRRRAIRGKKRTKTRRNLPEKEVPFTLRWGQFITVPRMCHVTLHINSRGRNSCPQLGVKCVNGWHAHLYINPKKEGYYGKCWDVMF